MTSFCTVCGAIALGSRFCPNCGKPVTAVPQESDSEIANLGSLLGSPVPRPQPHQIPTFESPTSIRKFLGELVLELTKQSKALGLDIEISEFEQDLARVLAACLRHEIDSPDEVQVGALFKVRDLYSDAEYEQLDGIRSAVIASGDIPRAADLPVLLQLGTEYCHSASLYTLSKWAHHQADMELGFKLALWAILTAFSATEILSPALFGIAQPWAEKFKEVSFEYEAGNISAEEFLAFCDQHRAWLALASVCIRWSFQRIVFDGDSADEINVSHEIWRSDIVQGADWLQNFHSKFSLDGESGERHPGAVVEALGHIWEFGVGQERVEAEQTLRNLVGLWRGDPSATLLLESFTPAQKYLRAL